MRVSGGARGVIGVLSDGSTPMSSSWWLLLVFCGDEDDVEDFVLGCNGMI